MRAEQQQSAAFLKPSPPSCITKYSYYSFPEKRNPMTKPRTTYTRLSHAHRYALTQWIEKCTKKFNTIEDMAIAASAELEFTVKRSSVEHIFHQMGWAIKDKLNTRRPTRVPSKRIQTMEHNINLLITDVLKLQDEVRQLRSLVSPKPESMIEN